MRDRGAFSRFQAWSLKNPVVAACFGGYAGGTGCKSVHREMLKRLVVIIAVALALLGSGRFCHRALAEDQVDLLLVLAADISRSLDTAKFKLQREGYAAALTNPKVVAAIASVPTGRIAICFVEWSGAGAQAVIVDWTSIGNTAEAEALAQRILAAPRLFMERTAIGSAIEYAMTQFSRSPSNRHAA